MTGSPEGAVSKKRIDRWERHNQIVFRERSCKV